MYLRTTWSASDQYNNGFVGNIPFPGLYYFKRSTLCCCKAENVGGYQDRLCRCTVYTGQNQHKNSTPQPSCDQGGMRLGSSLQYSRLNVCISCIVIYYMFVPSLIKCSCTGIYSLDVFWIRFLIIGLQVILISTQCAFLSACVPLARSSLASPAPHHGLSALIHFYTSLGPMEDTSSIGQCMHSVHLLLRGSGSGTHLVVKCQRQTGR